MVDIIKPKNGKLWDSSSIIHNNQLLYNILYPIGSVYISSKDTNPSVFFGGKWEQIKDVFPLFCGSIFPAGSTGGEAKHKLTVEEIPKHSHVLERQGAWGTGEVHNGLINEMGVNIFENLKTTEVGSDQPHNNMPPYKAFYAWERIA